jgi:CHAD domain-containing protein
MAFKFETDESFAKAVPRVARERVERVIEYLSERPHPDAESIHSARKDLKSLRAVLRLARGSIPDDETRRTANILFRDTGRALSPLRDSQALVEALQKFARGKFRTRSRNSEAQKSGSDFIGKVQSRIQQEAVEELPQYVLKQLRENLREGTGSIDRWFEKSSPEPVNEWETFVGRGLRGTYRRGKNIVVQLETLGRENAGDDTWHELRKCAKALGYQLRLLRFVWPNLIGALNEAIDQLTENLGDDHDLVVLRNRLLNEPYNSSETQSAAETRLNLIESLGRRRRKLQAEAYQVACRVYSEKPRQFENRIRCYWEISRMKPARAPAIKPPPAVASSLKSEKIGAPPSETVRLSSHPRGRAQNIAN